MKKHFERPSKDFTVTSSEWQLDIVRNHTNAGFEHIPDSEVMDKFWVLLCFLQEHGMLQSFPAACRQDVDMRTTLKNSDLTDKGYYFLQRNVQRWGGRLYKRQAKDKDRAFLEKWYAEFQAQSA